MTIITQHEGPTIMPRIQNIFKNHNCTAHETHKELLLDDHIKYLLTQIS